MSFSDELNAFVHNYPYCNYHELVLDFLTKLVQELDKIVKDADLEHLPERLQAINDALDANQQAISLLESASASASEAIRDLRAITSAQSEDLEAIHEEIDGVIEDLQASINELETDYNAFKTSTNSRLTTLEDAAFDPSQIVMTNNPFNFVLSLIDGAKNGVRIVVDESISADDSIQWVDGATWYVTNVPDKQRFLTWHKIPRFFSSGNPCHLVIPSVFPNVYRTGASWTLYFYCHRWVGEWSDNNGLNKVGPITFNELLAEGGKQITATPETGPFNDMELVKNESTGCYDLHIYNGRNGYTYYGDVMFDNMMVLPINLGNEWETSVKQKYYNLLNTYLTQTTSNIDSKISSAISEALTPVSEDLDDIAADAFKKSELRTLDFTPLSGVSVIANHSYQLAGVKGNERYTIAFIDMILDVTGLTDNSTMNIGDLDFYFDNLSGARSLEVAIEHANNGAFGSITAGGALAIKAYGTFETTTRIRVTASIADKYTIT